MDKCQQFQLTNVSSLRLPSALQVHQEIAAMETEMNDLYESAGLFEVIVPEFKQLKACRKEVGMLKVLWDMITVVQSSFSDWNTTLWKDINVENMEMDCKKFVKVCCYVECVFSVQY